MFGLIRYCLAYRLLEARVAELQSELRQEKANNTELLNKVLRLAKVEPMFHQPPPVTEAPPPPPIGPTAKKALLAQQRQNETVKTDEEILEAANAALSKNGNGHG